MRLRAIKIYHHARGPHKSMQIRQILEGGTATRCFARRRRQMWLKSSQFGARPLLSRSGRFAAALISGAAISHRQLITINFVSLSISRAIKAMVKQYNCPDGGALTTLARCGTRNWLLVVCVCVFVFAPILMSRRWRQNSGSEPENHPPPTSRPQWYYISHAHVHTEGQVALSWCLLKWHVHFALTLQVTALVPTSQKNETCLSFARAQDFLNWESALSGEQTDEWRWKSHERGLIRFGRAQQGGLACSTRLVGLQPLLLRPN
jgi:hypothetical protein